MQDLGLSSVAQEAMIVVMDDNVVPVDGDMKRFGELVRGAREALRMSPQQLADVLHRTASYVSRLETGGIKTPPPDVVAGLARSLYLDEQVLVRLIGYLSTVVEGDEQSGVAAHPFAPDDKRAQIVDMLRRLEEPGISIALKLMVAVSEGLIPPT